MVLKEGTFLILGLLAFVCCQWSSLGSPSLLNLATDATSVSIDPTSNDVYIGGAFTQVGNLSCRFVTRWDGSNYSALGTGLSAQPYAVYYEYNTKNLYVGGYFAYPYQGVARWNGSSWNTVGGALNTGAAAFVVFGVNPF